MYILCIFEQMTHKKPEARFSAHLRQGYEPWFSAGGRVGMHSPNNAQGIKVVGYGYKKYYDKEINR